MERKNKLCPFCGGYSYYNLSDQWHNNNYRFVWVECSKCRAKGQKLNFLVIPIIILCHLRRHKIKHLFYGIKEQIINIYNIYRG